ncbi:SAM-dependent methyltransferase [Salipaludibacillus sp. LMS25]|jgi:SAM-dependent MidA family methyltransferase|uniref:class I SAM-dependent methyltransferase n=1 Tax=Salipaludibacillus sp. LMS25 TaxID=2924031 RepID=UPI0020D02449|nr:SAM-dependent methyltransferase [Salipaludibacillus sp. LMS25]UTR14448.1 SAM-dependent methyltransferase [Salipaludibacillus sp. LMS25]
MGNLIDRLLEYGEPPWDFADYMQVALYDPDVGYYMQPKVKLGYKGDFYTSNHVHSVFAETLIHYFMTVIKKHHLSPYICEWGAGEGQFANHALSFLEKNYPDFYEETTYIILETSPYHRKIIEKNLQAHKSKVILFSSFAELTKAIVSFDGVVFSNELIDAFPVHRVKMTTNGLQEIKVNLEDNQLMEVNVRCENEDIINWLDIYGPKLPEGYCTEVNLALKDWMSKLRSWLNKGLLVTIDYGYKNEELVQPQRKEGSIRGYKNHTLVTNPLRYPGEMDLTTHVAWDAFNQLAEGLGFSTIYHGFQEQFLLKAGILTFLDASAHMTPFSDQFKKNQAIQSLLHPSGISAFFQVNVQSLALKMATHELLNNDLMK